MTLSPRIFALPALILGLNPRSPRPRRAGASSSRAINRRSRRRGHPGADRTRRGRRRAARTGTRGPGTGGPRSGRTC